LPNIFALKTKKHALPKPLYTKKNIILIEKEQLKPLAGGAVPWGAVSPPKAAEAVRKDSE